MNFKTQPFAHQLEAFLRSRDEDSYALLMEQGTGKTKVAIDTMAWLYANGRIDGALVITPKSIMQNWAKNEIPAHLPVDAKIIQWRPALARNRLSIPDNTLAILIMNHDALATKTGFHFAKQFLTSRACMMIIDESTSIKNPQAKRTKAAMRLAKLAPYRRIMTGTPTANGPLDLFAQFGFLDEAILGYKSYYAFRNDFAVTEKRRFSGRHVDVVTGYKNLETLNKIIQPKSFRVTKSECLDLPDKLYQMRYVELSDDQQRAYNNVREQLYADLGDGQEVSVQIFLTKLLRLHQIASGWVKTDDGILHDFKENPKMGALLEETEQVDRAIIWATYTHDILTITDRLNEQYGKGSAMAFYGELSPDERHEVVDRFQQGNLRFFVGQPAAGGMGLTLTSASTVIYYSNSHSLIYRLQSEDRAHRIGQTRSVTYVDIVAIGTVDEKIVDCLRNKIDIATAINGDDLKAWL